MKYDSITKDQISKISKSKDLFGSLEIEFNLPHRIFGDNTKYIVTLEKETGKEINNAILANISFFHLISNEEIDIIKEIAFSRYEKSIKVTSYGMISQELLDKHNGNEQLANQDYFGITNKDQAFEKMNLVNITISDYYGSDNNYKVFGSINFEVPWDGEHILHVEYTNMVLVE